MDNKKIYNNIQNKVLTTIKMRKDQYSQIHNIIREVVDKLITQFQPYLEDPVHDIFIGGSFPRRTLLSDEYDIDIFVRFPSRINIKKLEEIVFEASYKIFGKKSVKRRFAEHPYAETYYKNIKFNIVPAYKTEPPNWISPVDRTYYHSKYLDEKMKEDLIDDILMLKSFLKGIDCYGAEISVKGFSGYLTELLILYYDSFWNLIEKASKWRPPVIIDIEGHYRRKREILNMFPESKLIVIDPVDRGRNVAANVSNRNLARFISACKALRQRPKEMFFYPFSEEYKERYYNQLDINDIINKPILCILIRHGEKIEDIYHGQLERLSRKISRQIEMVKVKVLKRGVYSDYNKTSIILLFLNSLKIDGFYSRLGPPTHILNEKEFLEKNKDKMTLWIEEDGRWHVIEKRKILDIKEYVKNILDRNIVKIPSEISKDRIEIKYISEINREIIDEKWRWLSSFIKGDDFWKAFY
jgi:tRNA nucleotidyltransferase (CCA-adding enzyme)